MHTQTCSSLLPEPVVPHTHISAQKMDFPLLEGLPQGFFFSLRCGRTSSELGVSLLLCVQDICGVHLQNRQPTHHTALLGPACTRYTSHNIIQCNITLLSACTSTHVHICKHKPLSPYIKLLSEVHHKTRTYTYANTNLSLLTLNS